MIYQDIEDKEKKTLLILYKVLENSGVKLGWKDYLFRKNNNGVDITEKEKLYIYEYLSDEGYIKAKEDLKRVGCRVYYQEKDLDNYVTEDGFILIKRLRKKLVSNILVHLIKSLKYIIGLLFG